MTKRQKKSETIEVRVSYADKMAFKEACEANGVTASQSIRSYITRVLHPELATDLRQRAILAMALGAALIATVSTVYLGFNATPTLVAPTDRLFQSLDVNRDGTITVQDFSSSPPEERALFSQFFMEADTDQNGKVELDELRSFNNVSLRLIRKDITAESLKKDGIDSDRVIFFTTEDMEGSPATFTNQEPIRSLSPEEQARLVKVLKALTDQDEEGTANLQETKMFEEEDAPK